MIRRISRPSIFCAWALGCGSTPPADKSPPGATDSAAPSEPTWSAGAVPTPDLPLVRGARTLRGIVHLHSPWSHDACDGVPLIDGEPDSDCLADLRSGLCTAGIDVAWLTDHPSHAAEQSFADRFHVRSGVDTVVDVDGAPAAARWACDDGGDVLIRVGYEDTLMPVGLLAPLADDPTTEDAIANADDTDTIHTMLDRGALVAVAHTEGRDAEWLERVVTDGVGAVELFNLHAAFDPRIRSGDLGFEASDWVARIAPFTADDSTLASDLLVLAVLERHTVSLAHWDRLTAAGHRVVGTAGTDAHQNTLPMDLPDGERGDSFRRMVRWWTQHIRVAESEATDPAAIQDALARGHFHVVAEVLGTPTGFDVYATAADGSVVETGGTVSGGTLTVTCPTLAPTSPQGPDAPDLTVTVLHNGAAWATGCGDHPLSAPGAYRVEVDIVPHHLRPFLGAVADDWMTAYPWLFSQPIYVDADG